MFGYLLYMAPVILLSLIAQLLVSGSYKKYNKIKSRRGITGREAAALILESNGIRDIKINRIPGNLTDHYDPRDNTISLSDNVYDSDSVAAIGIAAHEAGHALQYKTGYSFIKLRMLILPVCSFGSRLGPILIFIGLILSSFEFFWAGIILFGAVAVFQLVTLPVEFNASVRAVKILESSGTLGSDELKGAKSVLTAAALTYVAALLTSLMQIMYYISRANRR
ncbi:MAG TPA: peptidase [Clostridiales bacterium]|nr:zinc metallopeptidase [Eubacteriales bacterium]HBR30797.1 peptidase [Clostridiales bacterium]